MAECRNCHRDIPEDAYLCPYCGLRRAYFSGIYDINTGMMATSGTIVEYFSTYAQALSTAMKNPGSPLLDAGVEDFQKFWPTIPVELKHRIREGNEAIRNFNLWVEKHERATRIVFLIRTTNLMFQSKRQAKLFREDNPLIVTELYNPCENEHDFTAKIAGLASLFEVPLDPLQKIVQKHGEMRSNMLVETWLRESTISYDPSMVETWRKIVDLRNMQPIHVHTSEEKLVSALTFFGTALPIDYGLCWDRILSKFKTSLEEWQRILQLL